MEADEILVGRHGAADIRFTDMSVSRYHAVLYVSNGVWSVMDLGSKSGTYVNGRKIRSQVKLKDMDEIRFGTLDLFNVRNGNVVGSNTDPNGGMRKVFELTCDDIYAVYGIALTVPQLQTRLDTGEIKLGEKSADSRKRTLKSRTYSFENILLENSHKVFDSVVDSLIQVYNIAENYSYILITGGTSDAWMDYIKDAFADADTIKVVAANANDPSISNIYSNARGYFFQRMNTKAA